MAVLVIFCPREGGVRVREKAPGWRGRIPLGSSYPPLRPATSRSMSEIETSRDEKGAIDTVE